MKKILIIFALLSLSVSSHAHQRKFFPSLKTFQVGQCLTVDVIEYLPFTAANYYLTNRCNYTIFYTQNGQNDHIDPMTLKESYFTGNINRPFIIKKVVK